MRSEEAATAAWETVDWVLERTVERGRGAEGRPVEEVIDETLYHERERLSKAEAWA